MVWAFDEFEVDSAACELRRRGRPVVLQPRVFDTLRYLIENSSRVVSRQELLDALWKGQRVKPGAVPWCVNHVRRALGQRALDKYPIDTIRGRGYRFVASVRRQGARVDSVPPETSPRWPAADGVEGPFIGRSDVMGRLVDCLSSARAGEGGIVLLTGPQGIGKTRSMTELSSLAQAWGLGVWSGRCIADCGAPGLFPFISLLREARADRTLSAPERVEAEELVAALSPRQAEPGGDELRAQAGHDAGRFWLLDKIVHFLRRAAQQRARLVLLDDVQDADASSLDVLSWLSPDLPRSKLLVVVSARQSVNGTSLSTLEARIRPARVVALTPWRDADVKQYLDARMGAEAPPDFAPAVFALSAGNPLFAREAVSLLTDRKRFGAPDESSSSELPLVAQEVLARRVALLAEPVRSVLEIACVIGEQFDLPLLQKVTGLGSAELLSRLDAAIFAQFLRAKTPLERYEFSHGLIHASLYEGLAASRRVALHGEIAAALEALSQFEPRLYELAYHLYKGLPESGYERALAVCRKAGDAAVGAFAYDDAAKFYGWALAAQRYAQGPDPRTSCELLLASAFAFRRAGSMPESVLHCARAIELSTAEGFADLLLEAAGCLRPTVWMALVPDPFALKALTTALELLPEDAKVERTRAYGKLAGLPPHSCAVEESQALGGRAVALARELGNPGLLLESLGYSLHGLSGPDHLDQLLAVTEEMLRLADKEMAWWTAEAYVGRYLAFLQRADLPSAERALKSFGDVAHALRWPEAIWQYDRYSVLLRFHAGELEYAEARFAELNEQAKRLRLNYARFEYTYQRIAMRMERRGHAWFAGHPEPLHEADWSWARGISCYRADRIVELLDSGAKAEAQIEFTAIASDKFQSVTRDHAYLYTLSKLSLAAVALDDATQARVLYEKLLPYALLNPVHGWGFYLGSVSYFLGVLSRFLGDTSAAYGHFEVALGTHRALGYKSQILRTQLALAEMSESAPGALQRGRPSARQVGAAARRLGLVGLAERASLIADGAR
ncbi:MAG TPA: AAA family ATPase [Polyangiaceae bacterium]|nr:AAA family ATPase [Polyangiaceae bacterium]